MENYNDLLNVNLLCQEAKKHPNIAKAELYKYLYSELEQSFSRQISNIDLVISESILKNDCDIIDLKLKLQKFLEELPDFMGKYQSLYLDIDDNGEKDLVRPAINEHFNDIEKAENKIREMAESFFDKRSKKIIEILDRYNYPISYRDRLMNLLENLNYSNYSVKKYAKEDFNLNEEISSLANMMNRNKKVTIYGIGGKMEICGYLKSYLHGLCKKTIGNDKLLMWLSEDSIKMPERARFGKYVTDVFRLINEVNENCMDNIKSKINVFVYDLFFVLEFDGYMDILDCDRKTADPKKTRVDNDKKAYSKYSEKLINKAMNDLIKG